MKVWGDVTVCTSAIPERLDMLGEALASVHAQTLRPAAHLVNLDYQHAGPEWNCNLMLSAVDTEWFTFLADDDYAYPDHLETLYEHRDDADVVWTYCKAVGNHDFTLYNAPFDPVRLERVNVVSPICLMRTELWHKFGGYKVENRNPDGLPFDDWRMAQRMYAGGVTFKSIPKVTWEYRFHGQNMSWSELHLDDPEIL